MKITRSHANFNIVFGDDLQPSIGENSGLFSIHDCFSIFNDSHRFSLEGKVFLPVLEEFRFSHVFPPFKTSVYDHFQDLVPRDWLTVLIIDAGRRKLQFVSRRY